MSAIKSPKAASAAECQRLEQLPNVGPAMAGDLRALGILHPAELARRDALQLYRQLEQLSGKQQDPCVLDTFMAVIDFMQGAAPRPWWDYTAQRKQVHGALHPAPQRVERQGSAAAA
ncbi:MAG TPA: helix-hairpin-helix domain-containing protein [Ideonella sp.]|uniref:helix-hairpin-helix domain-containing protein n=1 Tax=Ideonella sp. TaxID=1929293 RepID=UPI002C2EE945|nr:helix-hairpin-helix domain-containing protein [Ideonella sp.]HSI47876.1 helix-hairpin-helix domain-containing protein [Ideonella sp.]